MTNLEVVDEELLEAIWKSASRLLVGPITNAWHQILTLEPSPNSVVNTFRLPPVTLTE